MDRPGNHHIAVMSRELATYPLTSSSSSLAKVHTAELTLRVTLGYDGHLSL
jgi:hypothetical protein